jgi:hypothetical protein
MVYASELLLKRLLSCLCADVNNTSHDSCDIMCLIYANMFTLLLLLSPGECCWSWRWVSLFHEVSSVLKCWLLVVGAAHWLIPNWHLFYCLAAEQILQTNNVEVISYYPSQTYWMHLFWAFVEALGLIGYLHSVGGASQEVWTYRMARRCIPGLAVLLGCQYKVLKSVVQEPLAVRCRMRWVVYDNVVCLSPNAWGPFRYWHPFCCLAAVQIVQTNNV